MSIATGLPPSTRVLLASASLVIVLAGLRAAEAIVVPLMLSVFIAIIFAQPLFYLRSRGLPTLIATLVVVIGLMAIGLVFASILSASVKEFTAEAPAYQLKLQEKTAEFIAWLSNHGLEVSRSFLSENLNPGLAMKVVSNGLGQIGAILTNSLLILLTVAFILFEAAGFPSKFRAALNDPEGTLERFSDFLLSVKRYLAIKTIVSLATGALVAVALQILGVDFALLWGLLAFLLNYIPNIGSLIAAIPAVLLALVQLGPIEAAITAAIYMGVNTLVGSIIEPRVLGDHLGLSTLIVFISLIFWGWMFGPVGMLLAIPLTMIVKLALDSSPDTRWLAILLGSNIHPKSVHTLPPSDADKPL